MYKSSHSVIFGLSLLLILLISPSSANASTDVTENIYTSTTWNKEGSPYVLRDSITVFQDATLTIEPGVVIKTEPSYSYFKNGINVFGGNIIAIGSESEPIYFTSIYDDSIAGDADDYIDCYEPTDEEGNIIGPEVCDVYDLGDPYVGDWGEIYVSDSGNSIFKNVYMKYSDQGLTIYKSNVNIENLNISDSEEALTIYQDSNLSFNNFNIYDIYQDPIVVFESSHIVGNNLNIKNIYGDPIVIFNNSSFVVDNLKIENVFKENTDVVVVFNNSIFDIKNSLFKDCSDDACMTVFDGYDYLNTPSRVNIEDTFFDGGLGSGILTFSDNNIPINIKNSSFKNFGLYAIENYSSLTTVNATDNDWGDPSGPYHATLNPGGLGEKLYGLVDFDPWVGKKEGSPDQYYARITNVPGGVANLYDQPTTSATLVKTLPNDWVVRVVSKVTVNNQLMIANGYHWYKVEDPTDKTIHYMISGTGLTPVYLPYDQTKQTEYENVSSNVFDGIDNLGKRKQAILGAIDNYFSNTNTEKSLYSSDDNATKISKLVENGFPKELILAIVAQEISIASFDNERVSYDYGHGMMQITMAKSKNKNGQYTYYDNRGFASGVRLKMCQYVGNNPSINILDYLKCYKEIYNSKKEVVRNEYSNYNDVEVNPKYKQYANTIQSITANIKDGLSILQSKDRAVFAKPCTQSVFMGGYTFTCSQINIIKSVWGYNGASVTSPDYLGAVSDKLKNLSKYFTGYYYHNNDNLIEKLVYAGKNRKEIKVHSPVELRIIDSTGNITGFVDGELKEGIDNSTYDEENERAVIFFPDDNYTYKVVGDSTGGTYGLDINNYNDSDTPVSFNAFDIPIIPGEVHTYNVDQTKLASGKGNAVTLSIDVNADGVSEKIIKTGDSLSSLAPYDFYFKKPTVDGGIYKLNKDLPIKIKVVKEAKSKDKIPYPNFTITRVSDGYILPLGNKKEIDESNDEDNDDKKYYKKLLKGHDKNYTLKVPKNTMTEGEWKVEVNLGDKVKHSIIINMVK